MRLKVGLRNSLDSIELLIDSLIQTEHETKLIVGSMEEGRLRVTMKPKTNRHNSNLDQLDETA